MSKDFNTNTDNKDEWLTPPYILASLGHFDIDPCAPIKSPWRIAPIHYSIMDDGLNKKWFGRVWLNPPYGKETFRWMEKLSHHKNGIALIFARTETKGFHEHIWHKADSIFFFEGRIKFCRIDGKEADSANAPSCLVSYDALNTDFISTSGLKGKHIILDNNAQQLTRVTEQRDIAVDALAYYANSEIQNSALAIQALKQIKD